jgi:hypothetical protein
MSSVIGQADFGAGMYRGREAPDNAAYDLLNCLIDDEGQPRRRGGSAFKSNANAGTTLVGIADRQLYAGQRTVMWPSGSALYALASNDASPVTLSTVPMGSRGRRVSGAT